MNNGEQFYIKIIKLLMTISQLHINLFVNVRNCFHSGGAGGN